MNTNLLRIIGAASIDAGFRAAFFQDPGNAASTNGFPFTNDELEVLNAIVRSTPSLRPEFAAIQPYVCPRRPCLYAQASVLPVLGAAAVDKIFRDALFTNPVSALANSSFGLSYFESSLIVSLVQDTPDPDALRAAFASLGDRINAASPIPLAA